MNLDGTEVNLSEGEEHALQTLQASDPAIGMDQPDLVAIREKVETSELAEVSSLSAHAARSTRFPRWSYAAAAAVLLVGVGGGAGYSIAARGQIESLDNQQVAMACTPEEPNCNDTDLTGGISMICTAESVAGGESCNDTPRTLAGTSPGYAAGKSSVSGASLTLGSSAIWRGSAWLTPADSLPDAPGTGHAYIMSAKDLDRGDAVKNLIEAFGIGSHQIRHRSAEDGTRVTENDTRATIELAPQADSLVYWYYDNPDNGQYACEENYGERAKTDSSGPCKIKTGKALSDSEALSVAKEIFGTAGLDLSNVTWETHSGKQAFGQDENGLARPYIQVVAHVTVDGHELEGPDTVWQWTIELAPDKSVVHAGGIFTKAVAVPDYEIVGAKTAVLRSQDLKWSMAYGGPQPIYGSDRVYATGVGYALSSSQDLDDQGRPLLQVQFDQVEITKAELGLGGFYLGNDTYVVLPIYKLTGGGRTWAQLAVADKYLQVK